jgi:PAS domain S-box-containing protein
MRTLYLSLLLAFGVTALAAAEPRLRIGVEIADHPVSFLDDQRRPAGFTAELVAAMSRTGLGEVEIVARHWTNLLEDFEAGRLDALANVARTADRVAGMDFSVAHASVHGLVYTRRDRPPLRTTADFSGKTIAALAGTTALSNALAHGGWGATMRPFSHPQAAMDAVQNGTCDALLLTYALEHKYITNSYGLRREFVDEILHHFRFAVRKGDAATLVRINDSLATLLRNGTFDRLYDRWIGPIEPHPIRLADLRPYAIYISLGLLAITAFISWQRHLYLRASRQAAALRESEARFHGLVEAAFEGWIIHRGGVIVLANQNFAATFGYTVEQLTGKSFLDLIPPEFRTKFAAALSSATATTKRESVGLRQDGTRIPIETSCRECVFEGQPARIAAVRDLTAQHRAAADQLILGKLESTGILAGGIAHDFNNLLATMVLNVDMALLTRHSPEEPRRYLEAVKTGAAAAKMLTQQLITFAQGDAAVRRPTDLAPLLDQAVTHALRGSSVRSEIAVSPDLWRAEIDAGQIESVLHNLALNAREAMPAGGIVRLRAENLVLPAATVAALPPGEYLHLALTDAGHGIPLDVVPKIFDPYFSTKRRGVQKGMGLGLTIAHSIIHQHGGALTVDTAPGAGATFHLYLPATRLPAAAPPPAPLAAHLAVGHILVMDDEAPLRETVALALEQFGYTVALAPEGQTAVDLYRAAQTAGRPFDVVVLDLTVRGGMGGLATLAALRALDPAVKAVVMSGYSQEAILHEHTQHGFRAALTKPFNLDDLHHTLARVIAANPQKS